MPGRPDESQHCYCWLTFCLLCRPRIRNLLFVDFAFKNCEDFSDLVGRPCPSVTIMHTVLLVFLVISCFSDFLSLVFAEALA